MSSVPSRLSRRTALALALASLGACRGARRRRGDDGTVVLRHQPLWGDPAALPGLLAGFERAHPGTRVVAQPLPAASDALRQYYLTALEGGADDFDVLVVDVVWVPEFARAGWIADVTDAFPPAVLRRDMLAGAAEAVVVGGRTFAVPWYVDVGVLYRRVDLVPRAPATYADLAATVAAARRADPRRQGYLWQARQYEGLNCCVFEALWGHGGATPSGTRLALDTPPARDALAWLRGLVASGASPRSVLSSAEEECRRAFQSGRAVFMRNWPYAWAELQGAGSPVRGRVAVSPLPTRGGEPGHGTLGGWQLALNAHVHPARRAAALALVAHLASLEANVALALAAARLPPRRAAYDDPRLARGAPFLVALRAAVERARPRPVTPYYGLLAEALQGEFSAAVAGIRAPAAALARAQRLADHITGSAAS